MLPWPCARSCARPSVAFSLSSPFRVSGLLLPVRLDLDRSRSSSRALPRVALLVCLERVISRPWGHLEGLEELHGTSRICSDRPPRPSRIGCLLFAQATVSQKTASVPFPPSVIHARPLMESHFDLNLLNSRKKKSSTKNKVVDMTAKPL